MANGGAVAPPAVVASRVGYSDPSKGRARRLSNADPVQPRARSSMFHAVEFEARPGRPGARRPAPVGGAPNVRPVARPERRRSAVELPRRTHHGQQSDGRPPRLGPCVQGPVPAIPRDARRGAALPERLRLPGPLGRGQRRTRPRVHLQARHRGVRHRPVRHAVQAACPDLRRAPDRAVPPPRDVDGLERPRRAAPAARPARRGSLAGRDDRGAAGTRHRHRGDARGPTRDARDRRLVLHVQQREQRPHLGLPRRMPPARLALQGARHDALVRPLRDRALPDGDERGVPGQGGSRADDPPPVAGPAGPDAAGLDDDALDPHLERGGGRRSDAALRAGPPGRGRVLAGQGHPARGARGAVPGAGGDLGGGDGRLALQRPLRRPAGGPGGLLPWRRRRARPALRASRRAVERGRGRRGDRHRPHRARLRRGGLPAGEGARPPGHRPARRVGDHRRGVRVALGARRP